MATEYGYRDELGRIHWVDPDLGRERLEQVCGVHGLTVLARKVSEAWEVN